MVIIWLFCVPLHAMWVTILINSACENASCFECDEQYVPTCTTYLRRICMFVHWLDGDNVIT